MPQDPKVLATPASLSNPHAPDGLRAALSDEAARAPVTLPAGGLLARRDVPIAMPFDTGLPTGAVAPLDVSESLGPFLGMLGPFWVDLHLPSAVLTVIHPAFTDPLFVFTRGQLPIAGADHPTSLTLSGGTAWILARSLAPDAPAGSYVGFTVASGKVEFAHPTSASGSTITLSGPLDLKLTASPADRRAAPAKRPDSSIESLTSFEVQFTAGRPTITSGKGGLTFFDQRVALAAKAHAFRYNADLGALLLELAASPDHVDLRGVRNRVVEITGKSNVRGAWSLPLYRPADTHHFAEAAAPGLYVLTLEQPISARWLGATAAATMPAQLVIDGPRFYVVSRRASAPGLHQDLALSDGSEHPPSARLTFGTSFTFVASSSPDTGDAVLVGCSAKVENAKPIDAAGRPLVVGSLDAAFLSLVDPRNGEAVSARVTGTRPAGTKRRTMAVRNALLAVAEPVGVTLSGHTSDGHRVDAPELNVLLSCFGWIPTLPDPYVSNARATPGIFDGSSGTPRFLHARIASGTAGGALEVTFTGDIGDPTAEHGAPGAPAIGPNPLTAPRNVVVPTQVAQGRTGSAAPFQPTRAVKAPQPTLPKDPIEVAAQPVLAAGANARAGLEAVASKAAGRPPNGMRLLDVSSAQDMVGVEIGVPAPSAAGTFVLAKSEVVTPLSNASVFMLPQVQWEPVRTLEIDQLSDGRFPPRLDFLTDGGPTTLTARRATLVPSVPDRVVGAALDAFSNGTPLSLITTLPFGLGATLNLRSERRDAVKPNTPQFPSRELAGALALSFTSTTPAADGQSPGFEGQVRLTPGLGAVGARWQVVGPLGALDAHGSLEPDSAEAFVESEFVSFVPVQRIDVSGRGESCFSEWSDPNALAQVGSARFKVLVGRTALEVVKVVSVMHPWGIIVTRTVTIERRGGGGVIRRDSGWQAASKGMFRFPAARGAAAASPYLCDVEPGLFRGLTDVRNIRDAGGAPFRFSGSHGETLLVPKLFDANALIDGHDGAVSADAVLGFLQVLPEGANLTAADVDQLFALLTDPDTGDGGAIGGRIDVQLDVARSGLGFRARRVEVAWTGGRLTGVVRGAPLLRAGGAWGVARRSRDGAGPGEATTVEAARGTPLVRAGLLDTSRSTADAIIAPDGPVFFRDPEDLHAGVGAARHEYGFLQSSPAHALFFPDPRVDGGSRIEVQGAPEFADAFLRATTKGVFPDAAHTLVLERTGLALDPTGALSPAETLTWRRPSADFSLSVSADDSTVVDYSNAALTLGFDATTWIVEFPGLAVWNDILGIARALGFTLGLRAGTLQRPVMADVLGKFGGPLADVIGPVAMWFAPPPSPKTVELAATNAFIEGAFEFGIRVSTDLFRHPPTGPNIGDSEGGGEGGSGSGSGSGSEGGSAPPANEHRAKSFNLELEADVGYTFARTSGPVGAWEISCELAAQGKFPIVGFLSLIVGGSFKYTRTTENAFEIRIYAGIAMGVPDNPAFELEFSATAGIIVQITLSDEGRAEVGIGFVLAIGFEMKFLHFLPLVGFGAEGEVACVFHPWVHARGPWAVEIETDVSPGRVFAIDVTPPGGTAPIRVQVTSMASSTRASVATALRDAVRSAASAAGSAIATVTADADDMEVKVDDPLGLLTVAPSGGVSVRREEGDIFTSSGSLTPLGTDLGSTFTGNGGYAVGWWRGVVHVEFLMFFSISMEWQYLFCCRT